MRTLVFHLVLLALFFRALPTQDEESDDETCPPCGQYEHCDSYTDYECVCDNGFTGSPGNCSDINECEIYDYDYFCHYYYGYYYHYGSVSKICNNTIGSFECVCPSGYFLCDESYECIPIQSKTCPECENGYCSCATNYECHCDYGFTGCLYCDDIDECENNDTCDYIDGSICNNTIGSYECTCPPGYSICYESYECIPDGACPQCGDNEHCSCSPDYDCLCNDGFTGQSGSCEDIDECEINDCTYPRGSVCNNTIGSYECVCPPGYTRCSSECILEGICPDCGGNGYCNCYTDFVCRCYSGSTGVNGSCEDIDECEDESRCSNIEGSICNNINRGYQCICPTNYTHCYDTNECTPIGTCPQSQCGENEYCSCATDYECHCNVGFTGVVGSCEDIDECEVLNCTYPSGSVCSNTNGSYECVCPPGYTRCSSECVEGTCPDCGDHGYCNCYTDLECRCNYGFTGVNGSCEDIDECEVHNYNDYCNEYHEGFICNNLIGDYQCVCGPGYYFSHYYYECIRTCPVCGDNEYCDCSTDYECRCEYGFSGGSGVCKAYCPDETTNLLRGNYDWPEAEAGMTQSLRCNYSGHGSGGECDVVELVNATRYCNEDGEWEEPDVTNCLSRVTEVLCDIRNMGVTSAESTLMEIQMALSLANDTEDRSSTNLDTVTMTLQIVAENESIPVNREVVESAIHILSAIQDWGMDNSTLDILQSSSAEIITYFEDISEKLAREQDLSDPLIVETESLTFRGQTLDAGVVKDEGVKFSVILSESGTFMTESNAASTSSRTDEQASISLPPSVFELYSNDTFTLLFTMLNSSVLLPYSTTTDSNINVASSVIGATLLDHDVINLDDNITIILRLEYPDSQILSCVVWKQMLADKGDWVEDEGCITSRLDRYFVRCDCNHLSIFGVLANTDPIICGPGEVPNEDRTACVDICESEEEETEHGSFTWDETLVGETDEQMCPFGNDEGVSEGSKATRYCGPEGWMMYDGDACLPEATYRLIQLAMMNVTADSAAELVDSLASTLEGSIEQVQTEDNLDRVTNVLEDVVGLLEEGSFTVDESITENTVELLDGISDWPPEVVEEQSATLVVSFEAIAENLVAQDDFEKLEIVGEDITMLAERVSTQLIQSAGLTFNPNAVVTMRKPSNSSSVSDRDYSEADASKTNASFNSIDIPARTFENITGSKTGVFFSLYADNALFPIRLNQTESENTTYKAIGSAVLSATLAGQEIKGLIEPINITLSITRTNWSNPVCVSYNFSEPGGNWSIRGCSLMSVDNDKEVVVCGCSHLTNFGILVDVNARTSPPKANTPLRAFSIAGSAISMVGLIISIITLLAFRKIRQKQASKIHAQLCIAIFFMLLVFLIGVDRTENEIVCTFFSLLIQYFTMASVAWMGAEAVLMFHKLIIVFGHIHLLLISIIAWAIPAPFLIGGLATLATGNNFLISEGNFCFISDIRVFFGAFLGPILALVLFNMVVFVLVLRVLIRHTCRKVANLEKKKKAQGTLKTFISIISISFMFGLQWVFGAFTIEEASVVFQWLFVVFSTLQGFFLFLFFCVFTEEAREEWLNLFSCGRRKKKKRGVGVITSQGRRDRNTGSTYITSKNVQSDTLRRGVLSSISSDTTVEMDPREKRRSTLLAMPASISEGKETMFVNESIVTDSTFHYTSDDKVDLASDHFTDLDDAPVDEVDKVFQCNPAAGSPSQKSDMKGKKKKESGEKDITNI